jgi:hypothetical protein
MTRDGAPRETAAAGLAIGMTERKAQEAAISSFGPVPAVTRAHLARAAGDGTVLASVVMTAGKLIALLLLAAGVSGMAIVVLSGSARRLSGPVPLFLAGQGPHPAYISGGTVTWLDQPFPGWHASVLLAVAGAGLLACYGLVRRRSLRPPLAGLFPAVAVSVFGAITLALLVLGGRVQAGGYDFRPVVAACLAVTLGYAVRLGQVLLRQR